MKIKNVVVIGSGTMGSGIAAHLCNANVPVTLLDLKTEISEKARERIHKSRPPLLIDKSKINNIKVGNINDNFDVVKDADWVLLVGSIPRGIVIDGKKIEERSDLLKINGGIFTDQGAAIGDLSKPDAKILVVGNPANTNALIGMNSANNAGQQWFAMTALDANRAKAQLAEKAKVDISSLKNMIIWGNHSPTMYPDPYNATIDGTSAAEVINDINWLEDDYLPLVQQRGKAVIDARGASSAASAANAAIDTAVSYTHLRAHET